MSERLLSRTETSGAKAPSREVPEDEQECDVSLAFLKVKLMKLPNNKRESAMNSILNFVSDAVTKHEQEQSSLVQAQAQQGNPSASSGLSSFTSAQQSGFGLPLASSSSNMSQFSQQSGSVPSLVAYECSSGTQMQATSSRPQSGFGTLDPEAIAKFIQFRTTTAAVPTTNSVVCSANSNQESSLYQLVKNDP